MPADTVFTYGPANVTSLLATTLSSYRKEMADGIFTSIPLLAMLHDKKKTTEDGGATLVRPIMFAKNSTAAAYNGDDIIDTTIQDPFTASQWTWKQYAASISVTGRLERIQNVGKSQVVSVVKALLDNAEFSIRDRLDIDLFAASVLVNRVNSLPVLVDDAGTVGDISGTTNAWWQSVDTASGSFAARGLSDMRSTWNQLVSRNPQGAPEFIISDRASFEAYEATIVPQLRLQDTAMGDLGFENFKYKGATWMFDVNTISGQVYLLTSKSLEFVTHASTNFILSEWVKPSGQDLKTAQIFWAGELATNNRRKLGRLTGVTA